jgi:LPXTG-motif cell wall-anchored protein
LIVIFGGAMTVRFFRDETISIDLIVGAGIGVLLLAAALIWRKRKS